MLSGSKGSGEKILDQVLEMEQQGRSIQEILKFIHESEASIFKTLAKAAKDQKTNDEDMMQHSKDTTEVGLVKSGVRLSTIIKGFEEGRFSNEELREQMTEFFKFHEMFEHHKNRVGLDNSLYDNVTKDVDKLLGLESILANCGKMNVEPAQFKAAAEIVAEVLKANRGVWQSAERIQSPAKTKKQLMEAIKGKIEDTRQFEDLESAFKSIVSGFVGKQHIITATEESLNYYINSLGGLSQQYTFSRNTEDKKDIYMQLISDAEINPLLSVNDLEFKRNTFGIGDKVKTVDWDKLGFKETIIPGVKEDGYFFLVSSEKEKMEIQQPGELMKFQKSLEGYFDKKTSTFSDEEMEEDAESFFASAYDDPVSENPEVGEAPEPGFEEPTNHEFFHVTTMDEKGNPSEESVVENTSEVINPLLSRASKVVDISEAMKNEKLIMDDGQPKGKQEKDKTEDEMAEPQIKAKTEDFVRGPEKAENAENVEDFSKETTPFSSKEYKENIPEERMGDELSTPVPDDKSIQPAGRRSFLAELKRIMGQIKEKFVGEAIIEETKDIAEDSKHVEDKDITKENKNTEKGKNEENKEGPDDDAPKL